MALRVLLGRASMVARPGVRCVTSKFDAALPYQVEPAVATHTGQVGRNVNTKFIFQHQKLNVNPSAQTQHPA